MHIMYESHTAKPILNVTAGEGRGSPPIFTGKGDRRRRDVTSNVF